MKERLSFKRLSITAATVILLGLLYYVIFGFSAQDAEESGNVSQFFSEKWAEFFNSVAGGRWDRDVLAEAIESPLRKLAHFTEYACMGVLVNILVSQWMKPGRKRYLLTALWVFLSAAGDELHQYFVPGRYASFLDVLLDTCGGASGMLLCILLARLYEGHCGKRKRKKLRAVSGEIG